MHALTDLIICTCKLIHYHASVRQPTHEWKLRVEMKAMKFVNSLPQIHGNTKNFSTSAQTKEYKNQTSVKTSTYFNQNTIMAESVMFQNKTSDKTNAAVSSFNDFPIAHIVK